MHANKATLCKDFDKTAVFIYWEWAHVCLLVFLCVDQQEIEISDSMSLRQFAVLHERNHFKYKKTAEKTFPFEYRGYC